MNEKIIKIMSLVLQISPSGTPAEKDKPIAAAMYHGAVKILDASVRQQNKRYTATMWESGQKSNSMKRLNNLKKY